MKKLKKWFMSLSLKQRIISIVVVVVILGVIGSMGENGKKNESSPKQTEVVEVTPTPSVTPEATEEISVITNSNSDQTDDNTSSNTNSGSGSQSSSSNKVVTNSFDLADITYSESETYTVVNDNVPFFTQNEIDKANTSYESYSELDSLGRVGVAMASVGKDIMPTEERGSIASIKPSGWHTVRYDGVVDGNYLYNRCHLIGFQLTGENANNKNLCTCTRSMNVDGMLPFENMVADYVKETNNHVLYRVTPYFEGSNLIATGVLMEGISVEDGGDGIEFCVFVYNNQNCVDIDLTDGDSSLKDGCSVSNNDSGSGSSGGGSSSNSSSSSNSGNNNFNSDSVSGTTDMSADYILNTNSKKFHYPDCSSVKRMSDKNKQSFHGTRDEVIAMGYDPCGNCNP